MTSAEFNGTDYEDSVFSDPAEEAPQFNYYYFWHYVTIAGTLIKCSVYLAAVISNIYIITILAKFKRLRNRINNLILIYAVLNILFLLLGTLIFIILNMTTDFDSWYYYLCFINNVDHLLTTLSFYVLTFLAANWYILNYHPEFCTRVRRLYRDCIVIVLIVLAILQWIYTSVLTFEGIYQTLVSRYTLECISFVVCGIILICLSIARRFNKPIPESFKTEYAFKIPVIVFSFSLPYYLFKLPILLSNRSFPNNKYIFELLSQSLFLLPPIVILYTLQKSNKYFKMGYLKCCRRHALNYDDDDLDSGPPAGSLQNVAFAKDTEIIRF